MKDNSVCALVSYFFLLLLTLLGFACTWGYITDFSKETSRPELGNIAAILMSVALTGVAFGAAGCCPAGGEETKQAMGGLQYCYKNVYQGGNSNRGIALCTLWCYGLIAVTSFGLLQFVSAALMIVSAYYNPAVNEKVFASIIAAFDILAVVCGVATSCSGFSQLLDRNRSDYKSLS